MRTEEPRVIRLADYKPSDYQIESLVLDVRLDPKNTRVTATSHMVRTGHDLPLVLNGENLKLISVSLDGQLLPVSDYRLGDDCLVLAKLPAKFVLEIVTETAPAENSALEGLYMAGGIFCTQCEAEGFRRITYFLDRPDVMTVYTTRIEAEKRKYPVLLSNGNLIEQGDLPAGLHFAVWHDPFPKPCYLFALVAGDLGVLHDRFVTMSKRTIDLAIYVEHGNEARAVYAMEALKRAMKWDEDKYGREYDLDVFMIVAVSAFNMGAMENKGLNIFNDKLILASPETATDDDYARIESVVAHEYFHNWTGNRITCRDWFQLSLKEGLTVFRDQNFSADMRSRGVKRIEDVRSLRARQFQEDAGPLAHPVQPQSYLAIDNFYTATVYEKGAEVIGMLKTLVGDETYRKATDLYFERHDGQAATVEDWVKCFEDASGRDLAQFRLWYKQSGTPVVEAEGTYDEKGKTYALTLKQWLGPTSGQQVKKPMTLPVRLGLVGKTGNALPLTLDGENTAGPTERVLEMTDASHSYLFVNVTEEPLLSLGRHFSAPAIFKTTQDRTALATLMGKDSDAFNRWEAGQKLATGILLGMADGFGKVDPVYLAAIGDVLNLAEDDPAFAALMLSPPLESELAMRMNPPIDPDAIHQARMSLVRAMASAHGDRFEQIYRKFSVGTVYAPDAKSAGRRALRNSALRFLTAADDTHAAQMALVHYRSAANMTDMIAGLAALTRMHGPERDSAFAHFHDRFQSDPLVLDKWLGLQAGSPQPDTVAVVRRLMQHEAFDIRNPNRVRALIGAFSVNHLRFHAADGSGYALIGEIIRKLDTMNPQIAARMAGSFEAWRRYDGKRQALMRAELEKMRDMPGLSTNLFEVATKMLG